MPVAREALDPETRTAWFEGISLRALGFGAHAHRPIARWARAYRQLSAFLNDAERREQEAIQAGSTEISDSRTSGKASIASALFKGDNDVSQHDLEVVWSLIYGARTFELASRLLDSLPRVEGLIHDIGAGWGPFGLAAALRGLNVSLNEVAADRLKIAGLFFREAGLPAPRTISGPVTASQLSPGQLFFGFSFGEVCRGQDPRVVLSTLAARVPRGGRILILEPGTSVASSRLRLLRDAIEAKSLPEPNTTRTAAHSPVSLEKPDEGGQYRIEGPCPGNKICPMGGTKDWCHFTVRPPTTPLMRSIADAAERRWQEQHFSWLSIRAEAPVAAATENVRAFDLRDEGQGKVRLRVCTPQGLDHLVSLARDAATASALRSVVPGTVLKLDSSLVERRGDGLRLKAPEALTTVATL